MKVILFGATGMVGQGALRECLLDPDMFRPGFIQPRHGIKSKTKLYRVVYVVATPLFPLLRWVAPRFVTTTEKVGRAMLRVAKQGADRPVLENADINALAS